MKYSNFIKKYLGVKIDFDGLYNTQCVDAIDQYIVDVLGLKIGYWGNAKTWWLNRNTSKWLKDNFIFIDPTAHDIRCGDIGVRATGTYGHIYIIDYYDNKNNKVYIYDTNGTGQNDPLTRRTFKVSSDHITGILRPRNQSNIDKSVNAPIITTCSLFKPNAKIKKACNVYSDNNKTLKIGSVETNEDVKLLAVGKTNSIIQYGVNNKTYKVGIVLTSNIKTT